MTSDAKDGTWRYVEASGPSSRWCIECGLVVENRQAHERWHERIDQALGTTP